MLAFWCIVRYRKKKAAQQEIDRNEVQDDYPINRKTAVPRIRGDEAQYPRKATFNPQRQNSTSTTSSLNSYDSYTKAMHEGQVSYENEPTTKETYLAWNPKTPPRVPTLKSWLQFEVKNGVSPFPSGPTRLPISGFDVERPLGG